MVQRTPSKICCFKRWFRSQHAELFFCYLIGKKNTPQAESLLTDEAYQKCEQYFFLQNCCACMFFMTLAFLVRHQSTNPLSWIESFRAKKSSKRESGQSTSETAETSRTVQCGPNLFCAQSSSTAVNGPRQPMEKRNVQANRVGRRWRPKARKASRI
jgi:hypothetical protein